MGNRHGSVWSLLMMGLVVATSAQAENLIPNGSFEIGMGTWIGWDTGQRGGKLDPAKYDEMTIYKEGLISDTEAKFGRRSFCFNYPGFIRSKEVKLDPAKKYTLSMYAKSEGGSGSIGFSMSSSYRTGSGYGEKLWSNSGGSKVGKDWQRYQVTVTLAESQNGYHKLWISHSEGDVVWLDGIQLEEGETPTDYAPASKAEIGLTTGREADSNLFYTTQTIPLHIELCLYEPLVKEATVKCVLYDYRGFEVKAFDRSVALDADGYGKDDSELDPAWKGLLSLIATANVGGAPGGQEELLLGYVRPPRPASEKLDQSSPLGTHVSGIHDILIAEKLGIRWQRLHDFFDKDGSVRWIDVEPEEGKWNFQDAGSERYRSHGFNIVGTLWTVPKWALVHPDDVKAEWATHLPNVDKWRDYVYRTVSHFKDRIHYWEVWNEPFSYSWWSDTPENYFLLLKTTWEAAKEADPTCKILGGCLATLDYASTRSFMNRLFGSGGLQYMDILSIHADTGGMTASGPNMPEEQMGGGGHTVSQAFGEITELMRAYGEVKPIWNTEHPIFCMPFSRLYPWVDDVPWTRQDPPQNPVQGAQFVVRSTVVEMANNCSRNFFYPFSGGRYEDGDLTGSIMSGHMHLKSSGVVMSELLLQLGQATLQRKVDWGNVARCYLFDTPEGPLAVAWGLRAHEKPGTLRLPAEAAQFTYLDIMGNERRDVEKADPCMLPLGAEPVYIRASDMAALEAALAAGKVTGLMPAEAGEVLRKEPSLQEGLVYAGETELVTDLQAYVFDKAGGSVAILVSGRTDAPTLALAQTPGARIREIGSDIDISVEEADRKSFEITTMPVVIEAPDVMGDALLAALKAAEISRLTEFGLEGIWVTSIKGELQLTVRLRNTSQAEVAPDISIAALPPGVSLESREAALSALAPGKTGQVDIPLKYPKTPDELAGEVTIRVEGGKEPAIFSRPLSLAYALPAKSPITLDGDLSEWTDEGRFLLAEKRQVVIGQAAWKGPEDLSAAVRARWDDDFLYLAIEVRDDFPERRNEAMQVWNGTSVEVFVDTNQREDLGRSFYDKDDFQFLFGPATPNFPTDIWGIAPYSGKSHLPGLAMKSKPTADGYAMEIALPREIFAMELLPGVLQAAYGPGLSLGISIVANDRAKEQEGRKSSIVWGGTIRNYLDPSKFGTLVLLP